MEPQAGKAIMRHGEARMIDYTAAADIAAGDVVTLGNTAGISCGIAHHDIANGASGALAIGDAVYEVMSLQNNANYTKVWWDTAAGKVTTTSTNNEQFGYIVRGGGAGANTFVLAQHVPQV